MEEQAIDGGLVDQKELGKLESSGRIPKAQALANMVRRVEACWQLSLVSGATISLAWESHFDHMCVRICFILRALEDH